VIAGIKQVGGPGVARVKPTVPPKKPQHQNSTKTRKENKNSKNNLNKTEMTISHGGRETSTEGLSRL
jgi:hypothetical protein